MLMAQRAAVRDRQVVLGRGFDAATTKASVAVDARSSSPACEALLALAAVRRRLLLAVLPHVGVILTSLAEIGSWYQSALPQCSRRDHYVARRSTTTWPLPVGQEQRLSTRRSRTVLDLVVGLAIAVADRPQRRSRPRRSIDSLAMLPLAVPGIVLAFGYLAISMQLQRRGSAAKRQLAARQLVRTCRSTRRCCW